MYHVTLLNIRALSCTTQLCTHSHKMSPTAEQCSSVPLVPGLSFPAETEHRPRYKRLLDKLLLPPLALSLHCIRHAVQGEALSAGRTIERLPRPTCRRRTSENPITRFPLCQLTVCRSRSVYGHTSPNPARSSLLFLFPVCVRACVCRMKSRPFAVTIHQILPPGVRLDRDI